MLTRRETDKLLEEFGETELAFSAPVAAATGLAHEEIELRGPSGSWPCALFASSMVGAKVVAHAHPELLEDAASEDGVVSLRLSFFPSGASRPATFMIPVRVSSTNPIGDGESGRCMLALAFRKRPPDDLIATVGGVIRANAMAGSNRVDERITVDDRVAHSLGVARAALLTTAGVSYKVLLRDLSFSGALALATGVPAAAVAQPAALSVAVDDGAVSLAIPGRIVRAEQMELHQGITAVALQFEMRAVPELYKVRISEYLAKPKS